MSAEVMSGKEFIKKFGPLFGIKQDRVISINIWARFDDVVHANVEYFVTNNAQSIGIKEHKRVKVWPTETKRFEITVKEID